MKDAISAGLRKFISPSLRFKLKNRATRLGELRSLACLWQWELARLPRGGGGPLDILYLGRKAKRRQAMAALGFDSGPGEDDGSRMSGRQRVVISELPIPGALRVPLYVNTAVPLGRPLEEITASYDRRLQQLIRKHRPNYTVRRAVEAAEIDQIDRDMLKSFAAARHGDRALQMPSRDVRAMAQAEWGRLDVVCSGDEAVACQLGCTEVRAGKRYWNVLYFGCPEAVLSDRKRFGQANAMADYLGLEWAIENGFDYYDLGLSPGRPDSGSLQWKKHRRAVLEPARTYGNFYVLLPKAGVARLLWNAPLFSLQHGNLVLHLGIPDGHSDEEIVARYREMGFGGLSNVYLHCERPLDGNVLGEIRALYEDQEAPPLVETVPAREFAEYGVPAEAPA
ncbi:MAG: GNAT family N-acetyltransferase [Rudaea sp.]